MIAKEKKQAIIAEYGRTPNDTGSPEVQIAILSARIAELTEHFKQNPKDHHRPTSDSDIALPCLAAASRSMLS